MGVYLVSVDAKDWSEPGEDGYGDIAFALDAELERRGRPPYRPRRIARGAAGWFEEKISRSMDGFTALCRTYLTDAESWTLTDWFLLVPLSLEEGILLPVGGAYTDETLVAGAPQVLALAERLAGIIGLPLDAIPATGGNLELLLWFEEEVGKTAEARPGPWTDDLDAAFYVALYVRAAQYSLRHGCPMTYI
jgi:hypothetical protein